MGSPAVSPPAAPQPLRVSGAAVIVVGWLLLGPQQPREQAPPESADDLSQAPLVAAQDALDAWGRFAVTGDLGGHFHPDGPQYAQLHSEVPAVRARKDRGPPYELQIEDATVEVVHARHTRLHVDVTLTRPSEAARSYKWQLELVREPDDGWKLWTVSDRWVVPAQVGRQARR